MERDEFIRIASETGYCTKKIARDYCNLNYKTDYTEDHFVEVYRFAQRYDHHYKGRCIGDGCYTSKCFYGDGGEEGNR